jgi:uncharacterized protein YoxC
MSAEDQTKWVKADSTFITRYQKWKEKNQLELHNRRTGVQLSINDKMVVPKLKDQPTPRIKRQGMLTSTSLTPVGTTVVKVDGELRKQESFRLQGDLMDYMMALEAQNRDLQNQLEIALFNLKDSDLTHQRALVQSRSHNDKLAKEIAMAMDELNHKDDIHKQEREKLLKDLEDLQQKVEELSSMQFKRNPKVQEQRNGLEQLRRRVSELSFAAQAIETDPERVEPKIAQEVGKPAAVKHYNDNTVDKDGNLPPHLLKELESRAQELESHARDLERLTGEQRIEIENLMHRNYSLQSLIDETREAGKLLDEQNEAMGHMQEEIERAVSKVPSVMSLRERMKEEEGYENLVSEYSDAQTTFEW